MNYFRIYSLQDTGKTFMTVSDLLNAMNPDFVELLQVTAKQGFTEDGFSLRLIDELVAATLTANYGQSVQVHGFVGKVLLLGSKQLRAVYPFPNAKDIYLLPCFCFS